MKNKTNWFVYNAMCSCGPGMKETAIKKFPKEHERFLKEKEKFK